MRQVLSECFDIENWRQWWIAILSSVLYYDRARVKVRFLTRPSSSALPVSETLLGAKDFFIVALAVDFVNEMNEPPDRDLSTSASYDSHGTLCNCDRPPITARPQTNFRVWGFRGDCKTDVTCDRLGFAQQSNRHKTRRFLRHWLRTLKWLHSFWPTLRENWEIWLANTSGYPFVHLATRFCENGNHKMELIRHHKLTKSVQICLVLKHFSSMRNASSRSQPEVHCHCIGMTVCLCLPCIDIAWVSRSTL